MPNVLSTSSQKVALSMMDAVHYMRWRIAFLVDRRACQAQRPSRRAGRLRKFTCSTKRRVYFTVLATSDVTSVSAHCPGPQVKRNSQIRAR
jgi:hypothetical protein